jgi:hypothetical protein
VAAPALQLAHGATQLTSVVEQPEPVGVRWSAALTLLSGGAVRLDVSGRGREVRPRPTGHRVALPACGEGVRDHGRVRGRRALGCYSRQPRALTAKVPRPTCDEQAAAGMAFAARD